MKKRILSLCIVLTLCLRLLPATALAANLDTLRIGSTTITGSGYWTTDASGNLTVSDESNYNVSFDADANTLTLNNATIAGSYDPTNNPEGTGIYADNGSGNASLTIELRGDNNQVSGDTGISVYSSAGVASLTIEGAGSLNASGTVNPGIKVQSNYGNATLEINNATVTATSSYGSGVNIMSESNSSASLDVDGGSLTASGTPGILYDSSGSDSVPNTVNLTISNSALVDARDGGIGAGSILNLEPVSPADSSAGIVFDGSTGTVYGNATLQTDLTIDNGESLDIPSGASLTIPSGTTLTNEGTVTNSGTLTNHGTINNSGTLPDNIRGTAPPSITTTSLDVGTVGTAYRATLNTDGKPASWKVTDGSLPPV